MVHVNSPFMVLVCVISLSRIWISECDLVHCDTLLEDHIRPVITTKVLLIRLRNNR
jgi:hypothetical protein